MTKKSTGREVREAYDGPTVDHDALISNIEARIREEHARQSDGSESAAKTAAFLEETGLNSQAFSWLKSIQKKLPKKDGQAKAMDIIRSLEIGLPMVKAHVSGQGTGEMDFGDDEDDPQEIEPVDWDAEDALTDEEREFNADVERNIVTPIDFGGTAA